MNSPFNKWLVDLMKKNYGSDWEYHYNQAIKEIELEKERKDFYHVQHKKEKVF